MSWINSTCYRKSVTRPACHAEGHPSSLLPTFEPELLSSTEFSKRRRDDTLITDASVIPFPFRILLPHFSLNLKTWNVEFFFKEKKKERRKVRKGKNHRSTVRSINARSPIFYPSLPLFLINLFGNHRLTIPSLPIWRSSPSRCLLDEHLINLRFPFVPPSSLPYSIFHRSIFQRGGGDLPFSIDPGWLKSPTNRV